MVSSKKKILIIDDEDDITKLLDSRLKANQYDVVCASNGKEGLEALKKENPDLIILDIMMPVMDGFEFFKILKKDPENSKIPVLVLTARGGMKDTFEALDADEFVAKPFEADDLLEVVKLLFKKKALLVSDDSNFTDKIKNVLSSNNFSVDMAESEDEMLKKGKEIKYKFVVVYLGTIEKEPKDFIMSTRMLRNRNAKVMVYSDTKATGTDSTVAIQDIKTKWERAGVDLFFDPAVNRTNLSDIIGQFA